MSGMQAAVRRMRMRRLQRLGVLLAVLVVALVVVALLPQGLRQGGLTVAASDGRVTPTGVVQGRVSAERHGDSVCFSVAAAQGPVLLVLPPGWSADGDLRLRDAAGQTRVRPGSVMSFLGTPGPVGTVSGCTATARVWAVTEVRLPSLRG